MDYKNIIRDYPSFIENSISGRYLNHEHLKIFIDKYSDRIEETFKSTQGEPIHYMKMGEGPVNILIWSQMHGNETTGTKALADYINYLYTNVTYKDSLFTKVTIHLVPMLNPDGSRAFTRVNSLGIDLNRDAVAYDSVELPILKDLLDKIQPDFCFNLHDQRNIFNPKGFLNPATISFLSPSESVEREITPSRIKGMKVISAMNQVIQEFIPNHIGRYTDEFYPTATGDNFQKLGIPTILIEAGHFIGDLEREETRKYNFLCLLSGIDNIATAAYKSISHEDYLKIPENDTVFFDIIQRSSDQGKPDKAYLYGFEIIENTARPYLVEQEPQNLSDKIGFNELS
ncbi:MAG: M14 family zinc carboxypeptidase [Flavobacteriaceae bacterium]